MNKFSRSSLQHLASCCPDLVSAAHFAIQITDFGVICGHRTEEVQTNAFLSGSSQLAFPLSRHNSSPSMAFDLVPYHPRFGHLFGSEEQLWEISTLMQCSEEDALRYIWQRYAQLHGILQAFFWTHPSPYSLRWGGDWTSDDNFLDQSFNDLGHWELRHVDA